MHAKKSLGQNFLVGDHYPQKIVAAVQPQSNETILEIGPGHGALTEKLIASGARVVAIELDKDLLPELSSTFSDAQNFQLVVADAMKVDFCEIIQPASTARVVANLPYYISTPILQRLIAHRACLSEMTLMLQREVVDRIVAEPGGKEYGYLSALVQFYCVAEKLFDVPPGAFRPMPKVHSSILRLRVRGETAAAVRDEKFFITMISTLFAQRRKTILNNLRAGRARLNLADDDTIKAALDSISLNPQRRAETLSLSEMAALADCLCS